MSEKDGAVTLDFRDVVRTLKWFEDWPISAAPPEFMSSLWDRGPRVISRMDNFNTGMTAITCLGPATLREVTSREHQNGGIIEFSQALRRGGQGGEHAVAVGAGAQTENGARGADLPGEVAMTLKHKEFNNEKSQ